MRKPHNSPCLSNMQSTSLTASPVQLAGILALPGLTVATTAAACGKSLKS